MRRSVHWLSFAVLGFGLASIIVPFYQLLANAAKRVAFVRWSKYSPSSEDLSERYDEARLRFLSEYDRANPITEDEGVRDYYRYLEGKVGGGEDLEHSAKNSALKAYQEASQNKDYFDELSGREGEPALFEGVLHGSENQDPAAVFRHRELHKELQPEWHDMVEKFGSLGTPVANSGSHRRCDAHDGHLIHEGLEPPLHISQNQQHLGNDLGVWQAGMLPTMGRHLPSPDQVDDLGMEAKHTDPSCLSAYPIQENPDLPRYARFCDFSPGRRLAISQISPSPIQR